MKNKNCRSHDCNNKKHLNKEQCDCNDSVENKINAIESGKEYYKNIEEQKEEKTEKE